MEIGFAPKVFLTSFALLRDPIGAWSGKLGAYPVLDIWAIALGSAIAVLLLLGLVLPSVSCRIGKIVFALKSNWANLASALALKTHILKSGVEEILGATHWSIEDLAVGAGVDGSLLVLVLPLLVSGVRWSTLVAFIWWEIVEFLSEASHNALLSLCVMIFLMSRIASPGAASSVGCTASLAAARFLWGKESPQVVDRETIVTTLGPTSRPGHQVGQSYCLRAGILVDWRLRVGPLDDLDAAGPLFCEPSAILRLSFRPGINFGDEVRRYCLLWSKAEGSSEWCCLVGIGLLSELMGSRGELC